MFKNPFSKKRPLIDVDGDNKITFPDVHLSQLLFPDRANLWSDEDEQFDDEETPWYEDYDTDEGLEYDLDPEDYEDEDEYEEALNQAKYQWRDECEDASEYGLDPEDYETELEYSLALSKAKANARVQAESRETPAQNETQPQYNLLFPYERDDTEKEIKEEDYPNKRRYLAARYLQGYSSYLTNAQTEICHFIHDYADTILAANYLSYSSGFLYSQAIKDHFELSFSLPDEDEKREFEFYEIILKTAKRDIPLSLKIWNWCLEQFMPYQQYDESAAYDMTSSVLTDLYFSPKNYIQNLFRYMEAVPSFSQTLLTSPCDPAEDIPYLISIAIDNNFLTIASDLFHSTLEKYGDNWRAINALARETCSYFRDAPDLEKLEYVRDHLLSSVRKIQIGMVQDEIDDLEAEIAKHIETVEKVSMDYAFSRRNAWRLTVPDGQPYGLNPLNYDSEEEYRTALETAVEKQKYAWRKKYKDCDELGLDVNDFETEEEFQATRQKLLQEQREKERLEREEEERLAREEERLLLEKPKYAWRKYYKYCDELGLDVNDFETEEEFRPVYQKLQQEQLEKERLEQEKELQKILNDKQVYNICGVLLKYGIKAYSYLSNDPSLKIGDTVLVPVQNQETQGIIVSVGQYLRVASPFPIDKMKTIKCKLKEADSN